MTTLMEKTNQKAGRLILTKDRYGAFEFAKGWSSVSEICGLPSKPYLYVWYGKLGLAEATRVNEASKVIGKLVDNDICHYFGDKEASDINQSVLKDQESKDYYNMAIRNFHVIADAIKPKSVLGQQTVYSMKHKYIGTFDRLNVIDGKLVLADWKATNYTSYEYLMQLEAYYRALTEMLSSGIIKLEEQYASLEWHEFPLWLVQFPKKEEVDLNKNIIKFKPKEIRFQNFLNLLSYTYGKKQDEQEEKDIKKEIKLQIKENKSKIKKEK